MKPWTNRLDDSYHRYLNFLILIISYVNYNHSVDHSEDIALQKELPHKIPHFSGL